MGPCGNGHPRGCLFGHCSVGSARTKHLERGAGCPRFAAFRIPLNVTTEQPAIWRAHDRADGSPHGVRAIHALVRRVLRDEGVFGKSIGERRAEFEEYLRYGGFPRALTYDDPEAKATYIEGVVAQVVEKGIKARKKVRNVSTFDRVMTYVINNFGAPTSLTNLVDHFNNVEGVPVKRETIAGYLRLLESAKVLYKCERFDLKSRRSLRGEEKYYLADLGIYYARNTDARVSYGPSLENVLYVYLRSHGYRVSVGRIGKLECDFICRRHDDYSYVQVAMTIADRAVEDREYRPFDYIRDNYPQYLFTLDPLLQRRDGVRHLNLADFMAEEGELLTP